MEPMKIFVARMDGSRESGFARGAIKPQCNVPVTRNFDPREPPIGEADITIEGDEVFAAVKLFKPTSVHGLYPALGGSSTTPPFPLPDGYVHPDFDVFTVALCDQPNADPAIPAL